MGGKPRAVKSNYQEEKRISDRWFLDYRKQIVRKNAVIFTGAGISVAAGIPDFRSSGGLFQDIKAKYKVNGPSLFDYRFGMEAETRPIYYKFLSSLFDLCKRCLPTKTHKILAMLPKFCKRYRIYTQNIDGLEETAGVPMCLDKKETHLVYLHGNLKNLRCTYCGYQLSYTNDQNELFKLGDTICCQVCIERNQCRRKKSLRELPTGFMHSSIIHYYQEHPDDEFIQTVANSDKKCNLLIVAGTSVKVSGVRHMIRRMSKWCSRNSGVSIFVNKIEPPKEIRALFDFYYLGDSDSFFTKIYETMSAEEI